MKNNLDLIKGLIVRVNMQTYSGDKKSAAKIIRNLRECFNNIFAEEDDDIFKNDFEGLISSVAANPYITSDFFPANAVQYGKYDSIFTFTNNIKLELRWVVFCLKYYSKKLSTYISAREKYDNYILLNKYEEALGVVNDIDDKFGISLWGMECKFYLYVKMGKDINELFKNVPQTVFGAIINFFELKNRENVTSNEYYYIVDREIRSLRKIEEKMYNPDIELHKYYIQSLTYHASPEQILTLLDAARKISLIDKYLLFIDICEFALLCDKESELYKAVQQYICELSEIEDDNLISLRFIFDNNDNRKNNYILKKRLDSAKTQFIKGNLNEARQEAIGLLRLFPNNIEAINLYIDTNILLGKEEEEFAETNLGLLLNKLQSVYTLDDNRDEDIDIVNKFISCCYQSTWAKGIRNSIIYRCQVYGREDYGKAEILTNLQHLDIETMIASLPKEECIEYITDKLDMTDDYVIFRKAVFEENYELAKKTCTIEQINDLLDICNENNEVEERIRHLKSIKGKDAAIAIMGMKYFLATIDLEEYPELVLQISASLVVENIYTSLFIPLERIADYIDNAEEDIRSNICSPILYYVFTTYFQKDRMDDLGIICEDFFRFEKIDRPTKMDICKYEKEMLIYFLRYVCNSKVMDVAIQFKSTQERDQERVAICNLLSEIDASNVKEYEEEIRSTTQKLMINRELKTIEENRIHVNVEGIKDRLTKSYKNDFVRYKFYQDERFTQFTLLKNGENTDKFEFIQNAPERIFSELVFHIRDAFVSSDEYGLNGYLSLNFRHGTLEDELRSPLNKALLTAKKDITTNEYIINKYWISGVNNENDKIISKAISQFHIETEAIINKLKSKYIQIRTEEKNAEGIFDYRLYGQDFVFLSLDTDKCTTFDEFLDKIIAFLWRKTEDNLKAMKQILKTEILENYANAFSNLKAAIATVSNRNELRELQQKINEASTDMQNVIDRVCYWFQRSTESKHNDFDLQFAFDLGLQTLTNMHREVEFVAIPKEPTESDKIPGDCLKNYNDIFYNLFDNIYKKAYWKNGREIEIRYSLKYKEGKVHIYIENDIDPEKDLIEDVAKVEKAKELIETGKYIERVKGEGGTGIPKICKIINYDLRCHFSINFGYHSEQNIFFMDIKF